MSTSTPPVVVWSERRPGAWDQCTEGAYLMVMVYAGWRRFPAGIYTDAERDALDAATPPDPPAGGSTFPLLDAGALARYGVKLRTIADGSRAGLRAQLEQPGRALAIAGRLSHLPAGHQLRRWQPGYTGGHAIAVVPLGAGRVRWLDPLAPMGFVGDVATVGDVLTFAWYPNDARLALAGELEDELMDLRPGTIMGLVTPCRVKLPKGAPTFARPGDAGTPLPYDFGTVAIGVTEDGHGAYLLNGGGARYFRLESVAGANRLVTVDEAVTALRRGFAP